MLRDTESSCGGEMRLALQAIPCLRRRLAYKMVHVFGQSTDGYCPSGDLLLDSAGNLYGTTQAGGAQGSGMVFEIMH